MGVRGNGPGLREGRSIDREARPLSQPLLVLHTSHGLGNRLCAMATYAVIADHLGRDFGILWPNSASVVGTAFEGVYQNDLVLAEASLDQAADAGSRRDLVIGYGMEAGEGFGRDWELIEELPEVTEPVLTVTMSCMFVPPFIDPIEFHRGFRRFLCGLQPVPELQAEIDGFAGEHGVAADNPRILGVHIRRTDREESIQVSTDERFVHEMELALDQDSETRFLLATDSSDTEATFRARFGDRILSYRKSADPSRPTRPFSLESAVVELHLLARTHDILGSYASSFSRVAATIRGIRLHQVGFEHRPRW